MVALGGGAGSFERGTPEVTGPTGCDLVRPRPRMLARRCRASMAHVTVQATFWLWLRPESGLGFQLKAQTFKVDLPWLGSGAFLSNLATPPPTGVPRP